MEEMTFAFDGLFQKRLRKRAGIHRRRQFHSRTNRFVAVSKIRVYAVTETDGTSAMAFGR
jgi:hypothetical protein